MHPTSCALPAPARRMTALIASAALLTAFGPATGQTLYRCVQPGQPTAFQAEPCPPGARTASALAYTPDPDARPYRPEPSAPPRQTRATRAPRATGAQLHHVATADDPAACAAARRTRLAVLGRNNQGGDVDVRRRLNDAVARACY